MLTKMLRHGLVFTLGLLLSQCSKSGKGDGGASTPAAATGTTTQTTPAIGALNVQLKDVPAPYSSLTSISVTVAAENGNVYRYQLLSGQDDCSNVSYGDWVSLAKPIESSLGDDGVKMLCVLVSGSGSDGSVVVSSVSYRWIKDTAGTAPVIDSLASLGPYHPAGATTVLSGSAADAGSGVAAVFVSIQKSSGSCLNSSLSGFDAPCPQRLPAALANGAWSLSVPDSAFESGASYTLTAISVDQTGNEGTAQASGVWDTTAPANPTSLTLTAGAEQMSLSWAAASGATRYIVLRRPNAPVNGSPQAGTTYAAGQLIGLDNAVAYVGSGTSFVDAPLLPYVFYYYAVFAADDALNVSVSATGNALTTELPRFRGIGYAQVAAPNKTIKVDWQPFSDGATNASAMTYELYTATSSAGQNFQAAPQASIVGGQSLYYVYSGSASTLYLVLRVRKPSGEVDNNTNEFTLRLGSTAEHKIGYNGRLNGSAPGATYLDNAWALAKDAWGNYLYSSEAGILSVYCREITQAPYCKSRTIARSYTIAGTDGIGTR